MRFDLHVRAGVRERLSALAEEMVSWEGSPRIAEAEADKVQQVIRSFEHAQRRDYFVLGGVDGSGDYPSLSYGDSFVYVTAAHGIRYASDPVTGLREVAGQGPVVIEFSWLPEDDLRRPTALDAAFERMVGASITWVIEESDYRLLKAARSGKPNTVADLAAELIRPHAADSGNLAIQLRSTGELAAALQLIRSDPAPRYVLCDSTMSLPFVSRARNSLFHEHLKRLCCVEARSRGIGFFALSKSHGLPAIEHIERLAAQALGCRERKVAEHWYFRLPVERRDGWKLSLVDHRNVPPPGAVTYLVRLHKNVPVMRLDMDEQFWERTVKGRISEETIANEQRIFQDLDYASHDQRCYGYPYPIKAGHDRASLTEPERVALRKMIIDAAVTAGMKRSLFRNVSAATGHK
jgi:hypothetical protein